MNPENNVNDRSSIANSRHPTPLARLARRSREALLVARYERLNGQRAAALARQVNEHAPEPSGRPVAFLKLSSGILNLNLNNAFHLLTALALPLQGVPVIHFTCHAGMSRCVLGTDRNKPSVKPPCTACMRHTRRMLHQPMHWFTYAEDPALAESLRNLSVQELSAIHYPLGRTSSASTPDLPLGQIVLPSLRWVLRRHTLNDDAPTRFLLRQYILSAQRVAQEFTAFLDQHNPRLLVAFNGMFYPEAIARRLALARGIPCITHEVGLRPYSAFFTPGEATAYPMDIPADFELDEAENARLDAYLEQRFQGNFSMAGIRFWPEMRGLDQAFLGRLAQFKQLVPVFTNVIFDTSQVHANTIFPDMFAWLDQVLELIHLHPETLFVLRAHPDETRPQKESRETVQSWAASRGLAQLPNAMFIAPHEFISSYEMIQRAKFVMVYNSSIGLEASLMGAAVLCAGKARYTPFNTVHLPPTSAAHRQQAEAFLAAEAIAPLPEHRHNARRVLYHQLFRTSLPFDAYLEAQKLPGFVTLKPGLDWQQLLPENSPTMQAILDGLLKNSNYILARHS